jgi:hypothetical protein
VGRGCRRRVRGGACAGWPVIYPATAVCYLSSTVNLDVLPCILYTYGSGYSSWGHSQIMLFNMHVIDPTVST